MKTICMFSGQGSQYEHMGIDLLDVHPELKKYIDIASHVLNRDMLEVFKDVNRLKNTRDVQLMMVIIHKMYMEILKTKGIQYDGVLGFSLGEMSAWHAAEVISYEDLILLTDARAKAMQEACDQTDGTMAAVLKLDTQTIIKTCESLYQEDDYMLPVNFNSESQTVISGHKKALSRYSEALQELGGKLIPLQVAGAFHTPLMASSLHTFEVFLDNIKFKKHKKEMILNLTGELLQEDADIKQHILDQVIHPVLFTTMLKTTQTLQYTRYIEIGPGNVLSGLLKKTYPDVEIITIAKPIHLEDL